MATRGLKRWVELYVRPPRYAHCEQLSLVADDGTKLAAVRLEGPSSAPMTIVLIHGFLNWSRSPAILAFAERLAREVDVVVPDLRGHGRSGGRSTMGRSEPRDVQAAVAAARPGLPVVTVGTSLGGAAVMLHAGTYGGVAGAVTISGPAWWGTPERPSAQRLARWVMTPLGRAVLAGLLRTRVDRCVDGAQGSRPVVSAIAPAFVLAVHDPQDSYFGPEHPLQVMDWALEPKELWWIPGAGHGNDLLTPDLADRLLRAVKAKLAAAPVARAPGMADGIAYVAGGTGAFEPVSSDRLV
ncbi:MAG: alpha/beta hydrolase [Acidimicrobiales bacterium]